MKKPLLCLFLCFTYFGFSQTECLLGVGGTNDDTIAEVFQLSEEQKESLRNWSAELKVRNNILKDKANYMLKKHKESSPEVLMTFSREYKNILDSMRQNARMIDKRMLSILNEKQYEFYLKLCGQLTLTPIYVDGSVNEK
ncbi:MULTISPECIES: hypothetical protein [Flavobacteriaceae]|uniref:hypothetical protein n=1 Tax=Flavobacteriaceae TaxID=49546 RepID=UPI001490A581|nr:MULTISPECIES: hypothetical protein [Allomuricauda]MDC6367416.1 hypothetical protein [Muricauda sp. AC10]